VQLIDDGKEPGSQIAIAEGGFDMHRLLRGSGLVAWVFCVMAWAAGAQQRTAQVDKYAYLIPQSGAQALAWVKQQTDATRVKLEASPTFKAVFADMQAVHADESPLPRYHLLGPHRYLRFEHNQGHPYGRIEIADVGPDGRRAGAWATVFDLDAYNKSMPQPYTIKWLQPQRECLAPAFDRCMIPLWLNGGQNNAYIELDLKTAQVVKDGFSIPPGRNSVAWLDPNTLLVAHTTGGVRVMPSQFAAQLHVWKRGTPLLRAPKIYELDPKDSLFEFDVTGEPGQRKIVLVVAKTYSNFQLKTLTADGQTRDLPLPEELNEFGTPSFTGSQLAVQLATPHAINGKIHPADTIVAYDLASKRLSIVMEPPKDVYLSGGIAGTKDGLAIVGVRNLQRVLYYARPNEGRWRVKEQILEPAGTTLSVESSEINEGVLLHEQGLLVPPRVRRLIHDRPELVDSAKSEADLSAYSVEIKSARADDGVSVNYYLMHRNGAHTGPTPTILQGYGGFGVSDDPTYFCCRFGASWKSWFDRGGAFAIAAVRGGGERGGAWHLAGAGVHKKTMFDDFNIVAEDLERSGFTDHDHLGITGHSNGGILTAGAIVLRPDLYAAAVIGAPVTDFSIVGHGDGGIGAGMKTEFGSWDDFADRQIMQTWDPYFNIKTAVRYPPTLTVVATTDNQVGPSHARRFVAKMQEVGAPALLLEGSEGGHDYPDEYTQTADMAMQMSFFIDTLMKP
jgi:prolyl oligopeptidase